MQITARNTNRLARQFYPLIAEHGQAMPSRNGPVLRMPRTTTVQITNPDERVHFCPVRNANPFFHLFEAMAMFVALNDGPFLGYFAKNMLSFMDEGENTFNAFYGTRMHAGNQFINALRAVDTDTTTRRAYVDMWKIDDLTKATKDTACNVGMLFSVGPEGLLEMTTFNRSNDGIWGGICGANIVHFSFFQEFAAIFTGFRLGQWDHLSANLHVYTENPQWIKLRQHHLENSEMEVEHDYCAGVTIQPLTTQEHATSGVFMSELNRFMQYCLTVQRKGEELMRVVQCNTGHTFIDHVLRPMFIAWVQHKNGFNLTQILNTLQNMPAGNDWRLAAELWMNRNHKA